MPVGTALGELSFNCDNLEKSKSLSLPVNTENLLGCTAWSSLRKSRVRAIRFAFVLLVTRGVSVLPAADLIFLASIVSLHASSHLLCMKVLTGPLRHSGFSFLGKNKQTNKLFSFFLHDFFVVLKRNGVGVFFPVPASKTMLHLLSPKCL